MQDERVHKALTIPGLAVERHRCIVALLRFADKMRDAYGAPVYLCGSALESAKPRDIDVRIMLPDAEFERQYRGSVERWVQEGLTGQWTRLRREWSADCTRRTHQAWRVTDLNVDFQVYPESWTEKSYGAEPKVRLDDGV